jgi:Rrf2 family transcriptional regulator, nitric oxide-sensitive transcriptional repressor
MRLTIYTDYSLRVLLMLAVAPDRLVTINEVAERYAISKNHLVKVVQKLAAHGYIESVRGRNGGIRMGRDARRVSVGEVVRLTEENFNLVECFDRQDNRCLISPACRLRRVLTAARDAFLRELDNVTISDLTTNAEPLRALLFTPATRPAPRPNNQRLPTERHK